MLLKRTWARLGEAGDSLIPRDDSEAPAAFRPSRHLGLSGRGTGFLRQAAGGPDLGLLRGCSGAALASPQPPVHLLAEVLRP